MINKKESNLRKAVNELLGYSSDFEDEIEVSDIKEEPKVEPKEVKAAEEVPSPVVPSSPEPTNQPYGSVKTPASGTMMNQMPGAVIDPISNMMVNQTHGSAMSPPPSTMMNQPYGSAMNTAPNPMRMTAETSKVSSYTVETKTVSMEPSAQVSSKVAVITEDMIVNGDISTQSDLNVFGYVAGSIVCRGDIIVVGRVTGDISGINVRVEGEVNGNLTVDKRVDIGANGRLKGDIAAANVSSEGISEGDIKAEETIQLGGNSIVIGKVYAKAFAITQGAKIKGMMTTYD